MTEIVLVDDHRIVRDGIKAMLIGNPFFKIVGEAESLSKLLHTLKHVKPGIIVLDLKLPGENGLEILRMLSGDFPDIKVIMMSGEWDAPSLKTAVASGARGVLSKESSQGTFLDALDKVNDGKKYVDSALSDLMLSKSQDQALAKILTDRELQVMKAFAAGHSYKEIADQLFISTRTVESHKNNILRKLELETTYEMIRLAIDQKLV